VSKHRPPLNAQSSSWPDTVSGGTERMPSKGQQTGMRAVYLVAADLVGRGSIMSPASGNGFGADLPATNDRVVTRRNWSVGR
jgi:hypothetical protein